ncbi:MAG: peptidoglycan-binding domain-containing protein, partial [Planctomycetota bacterium]
AAENDPAMAYYETGEGVQLLQQALIDLGFPMPISTRKEGSPDGIFGSETRQCVREFQRRHNLSRDGVAGRNTWAELDKLFPGPAPPPPKKKKFHHRIRLHMRSISTPNVAEFTALSNARKVYEQYAISIEFVSGQSLLLSKEEETKLNVVDGHCKWDQENDERKLLHKIGGRQGVGPNDIVAYFVRRLKKPDNSFLNGCAGHLPGRAAVAVSQTGSPWTLGHEIGHVLLGSSFVPVHSTNSVNLMFSPSANITAGLPSLTNKQLAAMRKSRYCRKT